MPETESTDKQQMCQLSKIQDSRPTPFWISC